MNEPKRRGRPPVLASEERRARILSAAEAVFAAKGYSLAQMDDVVRACGMSKKTVYQAFATKEQLFTALVTAAIDEGPDLRIENAEGADGEALLREVLRTMAAFILSPRQLALARLVLAENPASPELGAIFFEKAIRRGHVMLAEAIRRIDGDGRAGDDRADAVADLLVGSLLGHEVFAVLINRAAAPSQARIAERIDWLMAFLRPALGLPAGERFPTPADPAPGGAACEGARPFILPPAASRP